MKMILPRLRLIILSDLHGVFPVIGPEWDGWDILILGDVVNNGGILEYLRFQEWLATIRQGRKVFLARGNHDAGQLGNMPSERAIALFDEITLDLQGHSFHNKEPQVITSPEGTLVLLDSVCRTISPHDYAQGEIGTEQMDRLDKILASRLIHPVTVALHHDPLCADTSLLLKDAGRFVGLVERRADFVVFGHSHERPLYTKFPAGETRYIRCSSWPEEVEYGKYGVHEPWVWTLDGDHWRLQELAA